MAIPPDAPPVTQEFLDAVRQHNLGHRLQAVAGDFEQRVLARYATTGYRDIRPVHGSVLRNLELEGTRLTTLAHRAEITHRAMAKIVSNVQSLGYVECRADPDDGRAKLIVYTERGLQLLHDSSGVIEHIYSDYAERVGSAQLERLEHRLSASIHKLGIEVTKSGQQALDDAPPLEQPAHSGEHLSHYLGRYLYVLAADYHHRCTHLMLECGHKGIRFDHLAVLNHLDVAGMKHSALAERAGISLQAIGKQVRAVQRLGYVVSEVDSIDKRARRVHFTPRGYQFITDLLAAFEQIKADYIAITGKRNFESLQKSLELLIDRLELSIPVKSVKGS